MGPAEPIKASKITPGTPLAPHVMGSMPAARAMPLATMKSATLDQSKLHRVARQFEAMFMTEMIHQANPKPPTTGTFRAGIGETSMRPFMDQALGDAVAARGGSGLAKAIERSLTAAARGGK
jgi:flagellar protein FlgJ